MRPPASCVTATNERAATPAFGWARSNRPFSGARSSARACPSHTPRRRSRTPSGASGGWPGPFMATLARNLGVEADGYPTCGPDTGGCVAESAGRRFVVAIPPHRPSMTRFDRTMRDCRGSRMCAFATRTSRGARAACGRGAAPASHARRATTQESTGRKLVARRSPWVACIGSGDDSVRRPRRSTNAARCSPAHRTRWERWPRCSMLEP